MKKNYLFIYKILFQAGIFISIFFSSCKKFVEVPLPNDQLSSEFVFTNDNSAIQSITGIYSEMMNNQSQFSDGLTSMFAGMAADELYYYTAGFRDEFVNNQLSSINHSNLESYFWNPCYRYIYAANKCIEEVEGSGKLSQPVKQMVLGEAKFIRAFCYFHLINLFGDVPLILSTDYHTTQSIPRTSLDNVYNKIVEDLKDAQIKLQISYPTAERTRPNKFSATGLLARVYLYKKDWSNAEISANAIITAGIYSLNNNLNEVFLINSNETIFQLRPVNPTRNTWEGSYIIPSSNSSTPTFLITGTLINNFETGDQRKVSWTKSRVFSGQTLYYPFKYKVRIGSVVTEYYVVLRLAEQYLIRAEARIQQNNITGALSDLNVIRIRAGLPNTLATSVNEIVAAIEQERRMELFAEWGHRWFDLKRTDRANTILGSLKPITWQPTDLLWPIPQGQINLNSSLTQNPGY